MQILWKEIRLIRKDGFWTYSGQKTSPMTGLSLATRPVSTSTANTRTQPTKLFLEARMGHEPCCFVHGNRSFFNTQATTNQVAFDRRGAFVAVGSVLDFGATQPSRGPRFRSNYSYGCFRTRFSSGRCRATQAAIDLVTVIPFLQYMEITQCMISNAD